MSSVDDDGEEEFEHQNFFWLHVGHFLDLKVFWIIFVLICGVGMKMVVREKSSKATEIVDRVLIYSGKCVNWTEYSGRKRNFHYHT